MLVEKISRCRVCHNERLKVVYEFGDIALTGHFPLPSEMDEVAPMTLSKCEERHSDPNSSGCGLVQLMHNYDMEKLYGDNYGYRSSLNPSMASHVKMIAQEAIKINGPVEKNQNILDIASNDGTLLSAYHDTDAHLFAVDPTIKKFDSYYSQVRGRLTKISDFFGSDNANEILGENKFQIITSVAMLYDLPQPNDFFRAIHERLSKGGIWITEQSYLPSMIQTNSFDTVCHEHLEYYNLSVIERLAKASNLEVRRASLNKSNGGSFRLCITRSDNGNVQPDGSVDLLRRSESNFNDNVEAHLESFVRSIKATCDALSSYVNSRLERKEIILGYGASTKGNTLLQMAKLDESKIQYILDINDYKNGRVTPGSRIPIRSSVSPEHTGCSFVVLPWHFRDFIIEKEEALLNAGSEFVFPLPVFDVVNRQPN